MENSLPQIRRYDARDLIKELLNRVDQLEHDNRELRGRLTMAFHDLTDVRRQLLAVSDFMRLA